LKPGFGPEAIDVARDGTTYCGGEGRLARLDPCGRVVATVPVPDDAASKLAPRRRASSRPLAVSGIAVSRRDVFVAFGSGWSLGSKSKLYRFDRNLGNAKLLAEGVRGCCQRCDIVAARGTVYLAENSAYRVVLYDRDGEVLGKWGAKSRTDIEGFGSCCNPMNLDFDANGVLYTSESGLGRVKRYTADGKYLGLVGYVGVERFTRAGRTAASCSNIAIAVTPDGSRVYVMDYTENLIRVLQRKDRHDAPEARRGVRPRILGGGIRRARGSGRPR
jgi:sugar lactone lactonase YvrE